MIQTAMHHHAGMHCVKETFGAQSKGWHAVHLRSVLEIVRLSSLV